ncbi:MULTISPECIES: rRNA maturation RNase YbeY [Psychrobacter]|uniref:rRNA maturation RNase YbeY n=1 Tax=Psychrobacter TaxID=497 RepID=UPI001919DE73|nr:MULTISPECIES: rRNA maturation RNase YbeY [Psychrobacter]
MTQSNDKNDHNNTELAELNISAADSFDIDGADAELLSTFYAEDILRPTLMATLDYINEQLKDGLMLPYFTDVDDELWAQKPKALDIYITDSIEGRALNLEARGKDNPTNILSYPSEMPANIIELMPTLPLGELIICHEVVVREAAEQEKDVAQHISHLLIHGVLHLFGFDHMLGQAEQDEMESFEIDILSRLKLPNPYL